MNSRPDLLRTAFFWLAFSAAVAPLVSIAASQVLIGLAFVAMFASRAEVRFPPIKLPLALFVLGSLIAMAFSLDPMAGLLQLRKFFVFLMLPIAYSAFRELDQVSRLARAWIIVAAASAFLGLVQFLEKYQEARDLGVPFYSHYVGDRMTGFMSHWQTFGGELMLVFAILAAFVFFSASARPRLLSWMACGGLIAAAIVLGFTRNIWLGSFVAGLYLTWFWRRKLIVFVPIVLALGVAFGPDSLRSRITSLVEPHGEVDSNQHRIVTYRTGFRMIQASPLVGLGPRHVDLRFEEFVPEDVPRPLPEGWYGHLHNIYLQYAAERGIPTLLCLLWLFGKVLRDFAVALRHRIVPEGRYFLHGAIAAILSILAAGFFEHNLGDSEVLTLFLTVIAVGYAVIGAGAKDEVKVA